MPNPVHQAKKYNFKLHEPFSSNDKKFLGTCGCGTIGTCSYGTLCSGKFCRNNNCDFFLSGKKLDYTEMKIIAGEKGCVVIDITGKARNTEITFKCVCGFIQKNLWCHFYREKWCKHFSCEFYHKLKTLDTELLKSWFSYENYTCEDNFVYEGGYGSFTKQKFILLCPEGHRFNTSVSMWVKNSRCKVCKGDGRTLSYSELKNFYEEQGCDLLYTEEDFDGNVTKNAVPFMCPNGHTITNLTKNEFNARINQDLGPCKVCKEGTRDRKEEHKKAENTCMERYGVKNPIQHKPFFHKQRQSALTKKFIFPSGKVVYVQGYEPLSLKILLKQYNESDIDLDNIPVICYTNPNTRKNCKYNPDIYIPSENLLIEVKSTYWLNYDYKRNMAKIQATVNNGYTIELHVFDGNGFLYKKIYTPDRKVKYIPANPVEIIILEN